MTARIACLIQARMGSSRLPGKVLADIEGKTMLQHVVDRCNQIYGCRNPVVITSSYDEDSDQIERYCEENDIMCLPVPVEPENVLGRYYAAVTALNAVVCPDKPIEAIVRVTSDCPLLDVPLCEELLAMFALNNVEYVHCENYPKGLGLEIFTIQALEVAYHYAQDPYDLEHVTPFIIKNLDPFYLKCRTDDYAEWDFSVDTAADLHRVRNLMKKDPKYSVCRDLII